VPQVEKRIIRKRRGGGFWPADPVGKKKEGIWKKSLQYKIGPKRTKNMVMWALIKKGQRAGEGQKKEKTIKGKAGSGF